MVQRTIYTVPVTKEVYTQYKGEVSTMHAARIGRLCCLLGHTHSTL
jgi:hypothetical protein